MEARKSLIHPLPSNLGKLLTMVAGVMLASLVGLASAEPRLFLPLPDAQLLWIDLITDGLPALALGIDPNSVQPPQTHAVPCPRLRTGSGLPSSVSR